MTNEPRSQDMDSIESITNWFRTADAGKMLTGRTLTVQIGVHFEEVSEMIESLGSRDPLIARRLSAAKLAMSDLADILKNHDGVVYAEEFSGKDLLDSLCDQIVTATGVAWRSQMNMVDALKEVDRSNWSKFAPDGTPFFNENGKIMKGPDYSPPNLDPFLRYSPERL